MCVCVCVQRVVLAKQLTKHKDSMHIYLWLHSLKFVVTTKRNKTVFKYNHISTLHTHRFEIEKKNMFLLCMVCFFQTHKKKKHIIKQKTKNNSQRSHFVLFVVLYYVLTYHCSQPNPSNVFFFIILFFVFFMEKQVFRSISFVYLNANFFTQKKKKLLKINSLKHKNFTLFTLIGCKKN